MRFNDYTQMVHLRSEHLAVATWCLQVRRQAGGWAAISGEVHTGVHTPFLFPLSLDHPFELRKKKGS